jgi:ATPase subunit of ABC transporter with duplicated ATPase domains
MISVSNLSLRYGKRTLFEDVNIKFTEGNCYGIIGANGAGKSTFMKILSGEIEPMTGSVEISKDARMSVLSQNHYQFDEFPVIETVIMGNRKLYDLMKAKDAIYMKEDFSDADGIKAGELEAQFAEMDGWNAENDAATLLSNLGIPEDFHYKLLNELESNQKVRVLLAQALFGNPDILLLDEPTNDLDFQTITWLEEFLADYDKIVLVVSHDRHFLDAVCTAVADIDFSKISVFSGNYSFWYESSQLLLKQRADQNKKAEDKIAELKAFIARFSANASKSKQATSRKKALDKINLNDMKPSNRRYPGIIFNNQGRDAGDQIIDVDIKSKVSNGEVILKDVKFDVRKGQKVLIYSESSLATSTITHGYLPNDNSDFFVNKDMNLVDWLRQYTTNMDETDLRGFLGRMLFSGEETQKNCTVLSGGEKMRCMLSRMMTANANVIMLDEPTNHLDLESITALNNGLKDYRGTALFTTRDHALAESVADRIIELTPYGIIDRETNFDDFLKDERVKNAKLEFIKK